MSPAVVLLLIEAHFVTAGGKQDSGLHSCDARPHDHNLFRRVSRNKGQHCFPVEKGIHGTGAPSLTEAIVAVEKEHKRQIMAYVSYQHHGVVPYLQDVPVVEKKDNEVDK